MPTNLIFLSLISYVTQKFDFSFEEEDSIEGMKKLIVEEVNSFRKEVRAQARAAGQIRRQDRCVFRRLGVLPYCSHRHPKSADSISR